MIRADLLCACLLTLSHTSKIQPTISSTLAISDIAYMNPRYQVFVSSTFRDLVEERQAALEAILELGHFPAGMEAFPAADATPWELIKSVIADSDYFVLIVGGRYGSTGPAGISYTEMEFNLAVEMGKPVLAFLHGAPEQIPAGKSELDPEARRRLDAFRARIAERIVKLWSNKQELKANVLLRSCMQYEQGLL